MRLLINILGQAVDIQLLAEHHVLYQYSLVNAANHYLGMIQTESVRTLVFFAVVVFIIINFSD